MRSSSPLPRALALREGFREEPGLRKGVPVNARAYALDAHDPAAPAVALAVGSIGRDVRNPFGVVLEFPGCRREDLIPVIGAAAHALREIKEHCALVPDLGPDDFSGKLGGHGRVKAHELRLAHLHDGMLVFGVDDR